MKSNYAPYYAAIRYLESLNNISGSYQKTDLTAHAHPEMYLERMQDFLDQIGNPENDFKYIHITGTSGKGSVSSLVHATLVEQGKVAGLFTSPFTVSTIEKIQVGKKYIDPVAFAEITEYLKPFIDDALLSGRHGIPSYFEIIFAIALIYFKQKKCEYVVLEVGLGGRYDATNIIRSPLVTAITNIGLDHTQVLGKTKAIIARDKSGIIKKGSYFFTTENDPRLLSIFKKACAEVGAVYNPRHTQGLDYAQKNILLAHSICVHLGVITQTTKISPTKGLPARFEVVEKNPLIIIDGAHNPSKIESTLYNLKKHSFKKLTVVVAISSDKDWKTMLKLLLPYAHVVHVTRFSVPGRKCLDPKDIYNFAKKIVPTASARLFTDPIQAFTEAQQNLGKKDALLVTGSFYLAGEIRALYCPEDKILKQRTSDI